MVGTLVNVGLIITGSLIGGLVKKVASAYSQLWVSHHLDWA